MRADEGAGRPCGPTRVEPATPVMEWRASIGPLTWPGRRRTGGTEPGRGGPGWAEGLHRVSSTCTDLEQRGGER
jgi:hypothetical protein